MGQLTLFEINYPYKYIFDTSSFLSQKDNEPHRRKVYRKQWENIDDLVRTQVAVTCSEVNDEIKDKEISDWLSGLGCNILEIDDDIQENVKKVVTTNPQLVDFKHIKSSGDAFLIATAMKYNLTVVTEESKDSEKKIPQVCKRLKIPCINILELCEKESWQF